MLQHTNSNNNINNNDINVYDNNNDYDTYSNDIEEYDIYGNYTNDYDIYDNNQYINPTQIQLGNINHFPQTHTGEGFSNDINSNVNNESFFNSCITGAKAPIISHHQYNKSDDNEYIENLKGSDNSGLIESGIFQDTTLSNTNIPTLSTSKSTSTLLIPSTNIAKGLVAGGGISLGGNMLDSFSDYNNKIGYKSKKKINGIEKKFYKKKHNGSIYINNYKPKNGNSKFMSAHKNYNKSDNDMVKPFMTKNVINNSHATNNSWENFSFGSVSNNINKGNIISAWDPMKSKTVLPLPINVAGNAGKNLGHVSTHVTSPISKTKLIDFGKKVLKKAKSSYAPEKIVVDAEDGKDKYIVQKIWKPMKVPIRITKNPIIGSISDLSKYNGDEFIIRI
jgi:hypothetical protein